MFYQTFIVSHYDTWKPLFYILTVEQSPSCYPDFPHWYCVQKETKSPFVLVFFVPCIFAFYLYFLNAFCLVFYSIYIFFVLFCFVKRLDQLWKNAIVSIVCMYFTGYIKKSIWTFAVRGSLSCNCTFSRSIMFVWDLDRLLETINSKFLW